MHSIIPYRQLIAVLIGWLPLMSWAQPAKHQPASGARPAGQIIKGAFSDQQSARFDSTRIGSFLNGHPEFKAYASDLKAFYAGRHYAYAWFERDSVIEQAALLAGRVTHMQDEGVSQQPPYLQQLDSLLYAAPRTGAWQQQLELMLSAQYFAYAKLAWAGVPDPLLKKSGWYLPRKKTAYGDLLDSLLRDPNYARVTTRPVYRQYNLLKAYLKQYHELESSQAWRPIAMSLQGESSEAVAGLKKRLYLLGDFKGDTSGRRYDAAVGEAVRAYQERNGLPATGKLNKATLSSLNIPVQKRIEQLMVNMERCRWLPSGLDGDYLGVNVPEFRLHVYHADSLLWSCNVVVGQAARQTTLFYGEISHVVFSPYWNVPPGILQNEIAPGMKADPDYLAKHDMEITGYQQGLPVVRQRPGPENSLGLVKFLFPNSWNIYLHDTPSRSLFEANSRAFSHGCIRVGEPAKLAAFLLKNDPKWNVEQIGRAMHAGKERDVTLSKRIPVFITYLTAFVDRDGKLNFRNDIYQLDGPLARMLVMADR